MPYLLAVDAGTTSARAVVFDDTGGVVSVAQKEFTQFYPQPGWVEHDAREIWSTQFAVAVEALGRAGISAGDVAAIGIANQRETTVIWDRVTGEPIGPAIVWQDRRTADVCKRLVADGAETAVRERTGLVIDAYFSATKIAWMLDHVPGARARAAHLAFGTIDTWLAWKLNGVHATDPSNASRTLLFNIHTGQWDDELLRLFNVPREVLPTVLPSSGQWGDVTCPGDLAGIRLCGVAGDQQAALFGQTCFAPGQAKCTYGTGCFLLQATGQRAAASEHRLLTTVAWDLGGGREYAMEGSVFIGGAVVQWLRDGLGLIQSSDEIEPLARTVPDAGGVYLVPAFAGLGAPHWDAQARGLIVGITRGITKAHIARAALEAIAFQVADVVDAMRSDSGCETPELRVDGGAARNDLLMQFQADLLGVPLVRPASTESTALGAAFLAGLAAGVWQSRAELAGLQSVDRRFEPSPARELMTSRRAEWSRAVDRCRQWAE